MCICHEIKEIVAGCAALPGGVPHQQGLVVLPVSWVQLLHWSGMWTDHGGGPMVAGCNALKEFWDIGKTGCLGHFLFCFSVTAGQL